MDLAERYADAGETFAAIEQAEIARKLGLCEEPVYLRLAGFYSVLGEFEEAANVLAEAAAKPNASVNLRMAFSQALLKLGDFEGAARAVKPLISQWQNLPEDQQQYVARTFLLAGDAEYAGKLLRTTSTDPEWRALQGLQAMLLAQPTVAARAFVQSLRRDPHDAWNAYLLGWACFASRNRLGALDAWQRAAEMPDAPGRALIGAAKVLALDGRIVDAEAALRRVGSEDQNDPAYWEAWNVIARRGKQPVQDALTRGYIAFHSGDPWQAEAIWRAALPMAKDADARELYAAIHNSAFRRQDMDVAFRSASEAAARWPRDPYFLKRRAELLLGQNLMPQALAAAEQLQKIAPPDQEAEVVELVSRIALDSGKPDLLARSAKRHRALKPSDPDPLLHLAEWQAQMGRSTENLEQTLKLYREAIACDPLNAEAHARAGILLADLKRPQEAILMLRHALTLGPRVLDGAPNAQLAQLYRQQGLEAERLFQGSQFRRIRKLKDGWPSLLKTLRQDRPLQDWRTLGEMALQRHETWIALAAFTRCTRLAPKDPAVWKHLAAAEKRIGRFEEALFAMRRAHQLESQRGKAATKLPRRLSGRYTTATESDWLAKILSVNNTKELIP